MPLAARRARRLFWDVHSRTWDDVDDSRRTARLMEAVGGRVAAGAALLDLGCGTGNLLVALSRAGYRAVGLDSSSGMLGRARIKGGGILSPAVVRADLDRALPFAPATFAAAVCASVLQCMGDPGALLAETHRVLARGGLLVIEVKASSGGPPAAGPTLRSRAFAPVKALAARVGRLNRFTPAALARLLESERLPVLALEEREGWIHAIARAD